MTGRSHPYPARTPDYDTASERLLRVRRWLAIHRRPVSAGLAFVSVLFGLSALSQAQAPSAADASQAQASAVSAALGDGLLEVPVRLSDPAVAQLLSAGDVVDVIGAESRGATAVVAEQLTVVSVPDTDSGSAWSADGDGLVVVAASTDTALALADAASRGPVTVAVHP